MEEAMGVADETAPSTAESSDLLAPAAPAAPTPEELDAARERARAAAEETWAEGRSSRLQEGAQAILGNPVALISAGLLQIASGLGCALMVIGLFSSRQILPRRPAYATAALVTVASFAGYVLTMAVPAIRGSADQHAVSLLASPAALLSLLIESVLAAGLIAALLGLAFAARSQFTAAEGWRPPLAAYFNNFGKLIGLPNYVAALPRRRPRIAALFLVATFTAAGLALLWVYVARLPTVIAAQLANFGTVDAATSIGSVLGIVLAIPFIWLLAKLGSVIGRVGRRMAAEAYQFVRERDERAPILFLRAFNKDDEELALRRHGILPRLIGRFGVRATLDELLLDLGSPYGPVVAIGRPSRPLPPLGAARVFVRGDDWQSVVTSLADAANVIVICLDTTAGVRWEAETVSQAKYRPKTIFLSSPWADADDCWRQLSEVLPQTTKILSEERPHRPVAAFTDRTGEFRILTAAAPTQQAYASALNLCLSSMDHEAPRPHRRDSNLPLTLAGIVSVTLIGLVSLGAGLWVFSEVRAEVAAQATSADQTEVE